MRTTIALLIAAGLLATPGLAQDSYQRSVAEAKAAPAANAVLRYGADDVRSGSLRLPAGKGRFPVVVLIHGGCWARGFAERADIEGVANALAKRGIAVWNVEYRQLGDPGAGWPGSFQDIAAAVDYLPALAKRYPLDLARVSFVGHSAGAHLALWAASRPRLGAPWNRTKVKPVSVVAIDGPGSLAPFVGLDAQVCGKPVIAPFMGGQPAERAAEYRLASPADHLPLGVPTLLVEGELAMAMTPYAAAARAAGDHVAELAPPGADHFDIITPGTANGAAVIDFIATHAFAGR